jgi:mannose-6-phosphate isomerase-like protein (cupin superfamily)
MTAVIHGPGDGENLVAGSNKIDIKATGADTGGTFFLCETTVEPGFPGPPLHRHQQLVDMFYVLEGTLTVHLDDGSREAGPGTFICVRPGTAHTFSNESDAPVRFLNFNTPAGWENYMRELATAMGDSGFDPAKVADIAARYDIQLA